LVTLFSFFKGSRGAVDTGLEVVILMTPCAVVVLGRFVLLVISNYLSVCFFRRHVPALDVLVEAIFHFWKDLGYQRHHQMNPYLGEKNGACY
jgi:hypothetical protein